MKVPLSICLDLDTRVELDRLAASELRSRSWLAEKFIRDGLVAAREQPVRVEEAAPNDAYRASHQDGPQHAGRRVG